MRASWMVAAVFAAVVGLGCAQNQEQPIAQKQFNRGSETPQETSIVINNGGDGVATGRGRVATSRPARIITLQQPVVWGRSAGSQPAGDDEGDAALLAAADSGSSIPTRGGIVVYGNFVQNLSWVDSRGMSKSGATDQRPSTGAVNPSQQGTQRPESQVNPAFSGAIGAMPTANSTSTSSGFGSGNPATSGPQSQDASGTRAIANLKGGGPQQLQAAFQSFLEAIFGGGGAGTATTALAPTTQGE